MNGYLFDTNVVSETRRLRADKNVMAFVDAVETSKMFISVLTLGELRRGAAALRPRDPDGATQLDGWIDRTEQSFTDRILPVDIAIARRWGELSSGRKLPIVDTLIAATALRHNLVLVTRNLRDVEETGVDAVDPWQGTP